MNSATDGDLQLLGSVVYPRYAENSVLHTSISERGTASPFPTSPRLSREPAQQGLAAVGEDGFHLAADEQAVDQLAAGHDVEHAVLAQGSAILFVECMGVDPLPVRAAQLSSV